MDIALWVELILFVILMGLSGFFSSSETSLFSLNELQLEQLRRNDDPRVGLIARLLSEPRRLIVTILIGNEFVNVAASVISAAIVIRLLGAESKFVNLFVMVPILLLLGEITPKTLAIRHNTAFATVQAGPIELFARIITPLRWVIRAVADWFTTLLVGHRRSQASIVTEDMVRTLAHEAVGEGVLYPQEAQYIDKIFDFGNKTLEDILTPRSNVLFLPLDTPVTQMVEELHRTRHTKVPVYRHHRDEVVGILYARDLLGVDLAALEVRPERLLKLLREPYFVPETKPIAELFHTFRKRKLSLALTVDEYGGVTGLVSMEDLLECIFGDIPSPSDAFDDVEVEALDDGRHQVDGAMTIEQFKQEFGVRLPKGDFETLGGLILHQHGELPPVGTAVELSGLAFTVTRVEGNRVRELTVSRAPSGDAPKPSPTSKEDEEPAADREGDGP